jgi:hypothetical protein
VTSSAADGAWKSPVTVASGFSISLESHVLATSPHRGATIAWLDGDLYARRIYPKGRLGPRRMLARSIDVPPALALTPAGATVAVWQENQTVKVRRLSPRSRLGRVQEVAAAKLPPGYPSVAVLLSSIHVALDSAGNATIVWSQAIVRSTGDPHNEFETLAAAAYARHLTADGSLGPVIELPGGGKNFLPQVAAAPTGKVTVAWWHLDAGSSGASIRVATVGDSGIAGTVRDVPAPRNRTELVMDSQGNLTLATLYPDLTAQRVDARGALGAIRLLGPIDTDESDEELLRIALDRAGNPTFVWLTAPSSSSNQLLARQIRDDDSIGPLWTLAGRGGAEPDLAVDPVGTATAAWVGMTPSGYSAILSRRITPKGSLGKTRTIAFRHSANLSNPRVVADSRGVVTVAWLDVLDRRYPQALLRLSRLVPHRRR